MAGRGIRKFWGWGVEGEGPGPEQQAGILRLLAARFGAADLRLAPEPRIADVHLPSPRCQPPASLAAICDESPLARAGHHYGKSYRDVVRGARGEFPSPPDFVAYPRDEADILALLGWCSEANVACIPYGGGSSVVGGVESQLPAGRRGVISLDLAKLGRVLEIDRCSRAARIEAGILGPALEDALRPHGLTLRHFPQSFEFSSLGGWIATRAGGHYATLYTHIDDFVESLRVVTPRGVIATRRLPGSGAGPSPDRLFMGSEGSLGIISEAWLRLQDRPRFRASASVRFPGEQGFANGAEAVRRLAQSGLSPANCRLLDAGEAEAAGAASGGDSVLVLGFESADHPLDPWLQRALECCRDAGGQVPADAAATRNEADGARDAAAGAWRKAFLQAPYLRDVLVRTAFVCETFETAVTWDRFPAFHAAILAAGQDAIRRVCGQGSLHCRFTHVYPDGAAPYYSVIAPGRRGSELAQWAEIKNAVSEAILAHGGTITHHHAIGRDHRPWYDRERPDLFAASLQAMKQTLDPANILNPGVLIG